MAQFSYTNDNGDTFTAETEKELKKVIRDAAKAAAAKTAKDEAELKIADARSKANALTFYENKAKGELQDAVRIDPFIERIYNCRISTDTWDRTVITLRTTDDAGDEKLAQIKLWQGQNLVWVLKTFSVIRGIVVNHNGEERILAIGCHHEQATHTRVYGFTAEDFESDTDRNERNERRQQKEALAATIENLLAE